MSLSPAMRIAGVLAPLFALRSENDLRIGDLAVLGNSLVTRQRLLIRVSSVFLRD